MRKIKEVLRLRWQCGLSHRQIAVSCRIGVGTVHELVTRARSAGLCWPLPEEIGEAALEQLLFPPLADVPPDKRPLPDWKQVQLELKRKGVTLMLLWEEYRASHPDGYSYSRYCELYQAWSGTCDPRMRQSHKAGEKLFVDYSGQTVPVLDRHTGNIREAQIFVATMGASSYTFAESTWTQGLSDWIASHVRAFEYFGGVPEIVVPDNLKSAVTSSCFYDPDLNRTYLELARYYDFAIVPARVRRPRDKAKVENGVQQVERRLLAPLRKHTFFDLAELNTALSELLDELNRRPFQGQPTCRRELFDTLDRPALRPLTLPAYQFATWEKVRVNLDYHISVEDHCYSVPYHYLKQQVDVCITASTVEVFSNHERIASHLRSTRRNAFTTVKEHMPPAHQFWHNLKNFGPERLHDWAKKNGPETTRFVEELLSSPMHAQQATRVCAGIMSLERKCGSERLEAACQRALIAGTCSYRSIKAILNNKMDRTPLPNTPNTSSATTPVEHPNIRGAAYFNQSLKGIGPEGIGPTAPDSAPDSAESAI